MATFGRAKEPWLGIFLALPSGIPSHDTFARVFARLGPVAFGHCFVAWVQPGAPETLGHLVAVDGKTLRGSHDRPNGQAPLHLVSAWAAGSGLVLEQVAADDKSNEITAIPRCCACWIWKAAWSPSTRWAARPRSRHRLSNRAATTPGAEGQPAHYP